MKSHRPNGDRSGRLIAIATLTGILAILAMSVPATAVSNEGTIKVHDDEVHDPPMSNQPHVSCDSWFWIEGFNMARDAGVLTFQVWAPTGDGNFVTPAGDDLSWTADADDHFIEGAYQLPAGHYKVTAKSTDEKDKSKVFWVDECGTSTTPSPEIPVFPSAAALALGTVGAVGAAFLVMRRKG